MVRLTDTYGVLCKKVTSSLPRAEKSATVLKSATNVYLFRNINEYDVGSPAVAHKWSLIKANIPV